MGDHLVLHVDRLVRPANAQAAPEAEMPANSMAKSGSSKQQNEGMGEGEPLIQTAECRICQEEDLAQNFEVPCTCSGSLKYAHRKCVQHWCNEKGNVTCEICHQPYQPGYTAPPPPLHPEDTAIEIGGGWTISGTPLDLHDPHVLAIAEAERDSLEAEYDDYAASSGSGAAFCRSAALVVMALLLLRQALGVADAEGDDDTSAFFSLFLMRAAGFLLSCYIMAWAISILQRRRQRQEEEALAPTQVAFVLQSGQHRGLQFTIASRPPTATRQETV